MIEASVVSPIWIILLHTVLKQSLLLWITVAVIRKVGSQGQTFITLTKASFFFFLNLICNFWIDIWLVKFSHLVAIMFVYSRYMKLCLLYLVLEIQAYIALPGIRFEPSLGCIYGTQCPLTVVFWDKLAFGIVRFGVILVVDFQWHGWLLILFQDKQLSGIHFTKYLLSEHHRSPVHCLL